VTESSPAKNDRISADPIPQGSAPLESIICTEELYRRASRPPDHERENRALVALMSALADSPAMILERLAATILDITQSDSAGLSLLTKDGKTPDVCGKRFYWPAIAGMWNPHVGIETPRNFSPCGDVLDQNRTLLFSHFERRYPYLITVIPAAEECLLVPFYVAGEAVGTIWAIMHSDRRKFDAEDDRVMASLGKFASSAYQALTHIRDLKFQVSEREKAEAEVRQLARGSEAKLRRLVEANVVGIVTWHLEGAISGANEAFLRMVQYDREDLASGYLRWTDVTPAEWRGHDEAAIADLKATGIFQPYEKEYFRKDGSRVPVLLGGTLLEGDGNEGISFVLDLSEQKQQESARVYSEEKYRLLVETASDAIVSIDQKGLIVFANPAIATVFGYLPGEITGKPLTLLMPEYLRKLHEGGFTRYLSTGKRHINWQGTELTALRKNGEEFPVEISFGELTRDDHKIFTGFLRDISKRKQAETALRAAMDERTRISAFREEIGVILSRQEDLKGMLHSCAGAMVRHLDAAFARIWTLSGDGCELELQASAGKYTHLDGPHSRIPVGQHKIGLIAQERKPHFTNDAQNDYRVSDKDWARREDMIAFAGYPLVLEDRLVGVMGMFAQKPLTESTVEALSFAAGIVAQGIERRRAEEALRRSEAFLAEGQRLGQIGSYSWRVATGEIKWSNELYRIYELEIGVPVTLELLRTRVHPQDLSLYEKMIERTQNGGSDFEWQFRLLMPDQSIKYLHSVAHATRDQDGQLEYIAVVQDVTERRQSEEALEKSRSELAQMSKLTTMGEMTASIAHEVNQPLTAVTNNANACLRLLANHNLEPDVLRRVLEEIVADGTRASTVIARIRAFVKKAPVEWTELDINEVIHEVLALAGHELQNRGVLTECLLTKTLPLIRADRIQLQQVLLNLVMNGIEAMTGVTGRPHVLWIQSGLEASGDVLVEVRDSGIGLGSEADRLFTPFFTTKTNGMGMGLSISRSLVEGHGGRLWASPNSAQGAKFSFTLPVAAESFS